MRRSARNQSLPQTEVDKLQSLTGSALKTRCKALYDVGWTLSAIGDALGRQRSTVRLWVTNAPKPPLGILVPTPINKVYIPKRPKSPGISPADLELIQKLAPLARRYRAKLPMNHPSSVANYELTVLVIQLHSNHVSIQELADAANVSYRAMYKRVKNVH
jgi:hypothetical protein